MVLFDAIGIEHTDSKAISLSVLKVRYPQRELLGILYDNTVGEIVRIIPVLCKTGGEPGGKTILDLVSGATLYAIPHEHGCVLLLCDDTHSERIVVALVSVLVKAEHSHGHAVKLFSGIDHTHHLIVLTGNGTEGEDCSQ